MLGNVRRVNIEKDDFIDPKQVQWVDKNTNGICTGIMLEDDILDASNGERIHRDYWKDLTDLLVFDDWVDFCPYIMCEGHDELVKEADEEEL